MKRLILPSIRNEVLKDQKEKADEEAISIFARNAQELLLSAPLGAKRKVYRCNSCGIDDQSDLCDGPIRQFEERARGRYAAMVANNIQSTPHSISATVDRIRQQTIEDAVHSGLSLNCKNIIFEKRFNIIRFLIKLKISILIL